MIQTLGLRFPLYAGTPKVFGSCAAPTSCTHVVLCVWMVFLWKRRKNTETPSSLLRATLSNCFAGRRLESFGVFMCRQFKTKVSGWKAPAAFVYFFQGGLRAFRCSGSSLVRSTPPVVPLAKGTNV